MILSISEIIKPNKEDDGAMALETGQKQGPEIDSDKQLP